MRELFGNRQFMRLFGAGILTNFVRWFETLFVAVYIFELTRSPFLTAAMTMMRFLPLALASLAFGTLADMSSPRRIYMGVTLLPVLANLTLAGLAALGALEVWHFFAGALVAGLHWAMDLPIRRSLMGNAVAPAQVSRVMALDSAVSNGMRMVGPLIGGVAVAWVGLTAAFLVGAVFYALSVLLMFGCREEPVTVTPGKGLIRRIYGDLIFVSGNPNLVTTFLITVLFNIFAFPMVSMIPVIGATRFELSPSMIGVLASIEGGGAFVGSLIIAGLWRNPRWYGATYVGGTLVALVMAVAFASSPAFALAALSLFLFGLGLSGFAVMQSTLSYVLADRESRGRFMGLMSFGIGAAPIGLLVIGWVAEAFGAPNGIRLMAVLGLLSMAVLGLLWRRRARRPV